MSKILPVVLGFAAAEPPSAVVDAPSDAAVVRDELTDRVKEVVREARQEEMDRIGERFAARAAQREKEVIARLAESSGLTAYQQDELGRILEKRREVIGKFFRTMFSPGREGETTDMSKIQEEIETIRRQTDEEIKTLLSPDQYEAFKKEEGSLRGGGIMGGRGR